MTNDVAFRERYATVLAVTWMAVSFGSLACLAYTDWAREVGRALLR